MIKRLLFVCVLFPAFLMAQPAVKGSLVLNNAHNRDFIQRNTKVVLLTKTSRDTVSVDENLAFQFQATSSGKAYLYLISPILPARTEYKFRIRKNRPTQVWLRYDKFELEPTRRIKTPEEREAELEAGLFIARLATDLLIIFSR